MTGHVRSFAVPSSPSGVEVGGVPNRLRAPSRYEVVPALASQVIGGPLGRYAVIGSRGWRPVAAVLSSLSAVFVALGVVQKGHCVTHGWATPGSLWRACYSDLPVAVAAPAGSTPWASSGIGGQPPLTAIVTWLVRLAVPEGSQLRQQQGMFAWGAAVIAVLIAVAVCFTSAALPRGPWAAAHVALSPVLVTVSLVSFDALAVAFVAAGLWAWSRQKYTLTGGLLACAVLTRPSLGVVMLAVVLIVVERRMRKAAVGVLLGGASIVAVAFGGMALLGGDVFASLMTWRGQNASYGSLWYLLTLAGVKLSPGALSVIAVIGWVGAAVLGGVLVRSDKRIGPAPVALMMLVVVMGTSRSLPVQAALWLLPLVALSAVRWRDHLLWAAAEFTYFVFVWSFVARESNPGKALPDGWFALITGIRVIGLFYLVRAGLLASAELDPDDEQATARE